MVAVTVSGSHARNNEMLQQRIIHGAIFYFVQKYKLCCNSRVSNVCQPSLLGMCDTCVVNFTYLDESCLYGRAAVVDLTHVDAVSHTATDVKAEANHVSALQQYTDHLRLLKHHTLHQGHVAQTRLFCSINILPIKEFLL